MLDKGDDSPWTARPRSTSKKRIAHEAAAFPPRPDHGPCSSPHHRPRDPAGRDAARRSGARRAAQEKGKEKPEAKEKKDQPKKKAQGLPLKPDRTVEFTTDEGTWVSLDVSPDGKTIVFELLGDLYTLPIDGGEAKAITTGMAFDAQPSYSPDGKMIAFVSDRDGAENVWVARSDGSEARPLTKDKQSLFASPTWTPDGDYVIASRQPQLPWAPSSCGSTTCRGGSGVPITKGKPKPDAKPDEFVNAIGAVASRDGKFLYYTRRNKMFNAYNNLNFPLSQVARRDRVTGDEDTVTEAHGSAFRPVLSPDGTRLVYGTRVDNETGLRIRELADGRGALAQAAGAARRAGVALHPRPDPRLCLHPRREVRAGGLRRQDPPHRRPDRRGPGDPVLGEGVAAGRLAAELPDPGGRRPGAGAADPGPRAVARRQAPGVLGARRGCT